MNERYQNMMSQVKLSDDIKANMKEKLCTKLRGTVSYRGRLIGIAACLCAVLVLAVVAAVPNSSGKQTINVSETEATITDPFSSVFAVFDKVLVGIEDKISTIDRSSFSVSASLEAKALDSFSGELQEDIKNSKVEKAFYARDELESYLGFSLISAPEIESADIIKNLEQDVENGVNIKSELAIDPNARYLVTESMLDGSEAESNPEVIKVTSHRVLFNSEVYIDARILTEYADIDGSEVLLAGESYDPVILPYHEFVINPNDPSDFDVITTNYTSAEKEFSIESYSMKNGCIATIITVSDVEMDGSIGFSDFIGYFVRDGVLYSVYPYAICDPHKDFPSRNGDMLTVLKDVLDSFE